MPYKDKEKQAAYHKEWYQIQSNKEAIKARTKIKNKAKREETRKYVQSLKENQPCTDCYIVYPHYVLQFDHVTDDKDFNISAAARGMWSRSKLDREVGKCELVCANCHSIRTWKRTH